MPRFDAPKEMPGEVTLYTPHPCQKLVHDDPAQFKVVVCGRRFGKTVMIANEMIRQALIKPGKYWYLTTTRQQAEENTWVDFFKKYAPRELIESIDETDLKIRFRTGGEIRLWGCENPESLRGSGLMGVVFDEYADIDPMIFERIVLPMLTTTNGWCWFMGTPKGRNHFYEEFIRDKAHEDLKHRDKNGNQIVPDLLYKSWQFKSSDSPYIPKAFLEDAKRRMSDQAFREEYEASFETYSGRIYKEYSEERHNILIPKVRHDWDFYLGIDTGRTTAVSFVGVNTKNEAYVFDEIYDRDSTVADICGIIKAKLTEYGINEHMLTTIIDSASQVKREYEAQGLSLYDSEKDVNNSIDVIRSRFKGDLLFFDSMKCVAHIAEHRSYIWEERLFGSTRQPKPKKENDHTVNAIQYVLNSPFFSQAIRREERKSRILDPYERYKRMDPMDPEYEKLEDMLGVDVYGRLPAQNSSSKLGYRDPVTGY